MLMLLSAQWFHWFSQLHCTQGGGGCPPFSPTSQEASTPSCHTQAQRTSSYVSLHGPVSVFPQAHAGGQRTASPRYCLLSPQTTGSTIGIPRLGEDPWLGSDTSHYRNLFYKDTCKLGSKCLFRLIADTSEIRHTQVIPSRIVAFSK